MNKKQKALLAFQVFCALILAILPFVDQSTVSGFPADSIRHYVTKILFTYKLYFVILCGLITALVPAIKDIFNPRTQKKEMRTRIMDTMMEELFEGDRQNVRITVFKDAGFLRWLWIYLVVLVRNMQAKKFRFPPWGKYIYAKERQGTEFPRSRTFFYYSKHTRKKCQGVAALVRQSQEEIVVKNLPDLDGINLQEIDLKRRTAEVKKVKDYMERGHMRDLESLKRIHRLARHFYGNILQNQEGATRGVLVIDSWQADCPFDDESVMKRLSYYLTLFTPTM